MTHHLPAEHPLPTFLTCLRTFTLLGAWCVAALAQAQAFPSRPVTLVVPWPAGGAADFVARALVKELEPLLGQPVVVDNVPGAGGSLGVAKALRAPADGHTLLLSSPLDVILAPLGFPAAGYRSEDARAVSLLGQTDLMLVTRKDLGANTLPELIALIKTLADKPPTYCAMGSGSVNHLVGEKLHALADVKLLAIPYSGLGPCVTDIIGGRVDLAYLPVAGPFPGMVDHGSLKAIAVLGESAHPRLPTVAPARATPGLEDLVVSVWAGIHVHAQVPDARVALLNQAVNAALAKPELRLALQKTGAVVHDAMSSSQAQDGYMLAVKRFKSLTALAAQRKP
jgi:tripartite-type tricarboxylate transporter receptor subunit TctC